MKNITLVYNTDTEPRHSLFCMPENAVWALLSALFRPSDTHAGMPTKVEREAHEATHETVHSGDYCINRNRSSQSGRQGQTRPPGKVSVCRPCAVSNRR